MALGYSVVNGTNVFPGIRYTGRSLATRSADDAGRRHDHQRHRRPDHDQLALGRLHVDERRPVDDCTFWYVNEYYTAAGQASSTAGWQTRIASFKLPGC